jgi:Cu/Ag efflux protein CusF
MEKENAKGENKDKYCDTWFHAPSHWVVRLVILFLLFLLVFVVGVKVGRHAGEFSGNRMFGVMKYESGVMMPSQPGKPMPKMQMGYDKAQSQGKRVAGTLSKVEGTKLTLVDNAGAQQTVYSDANTVIFASTGEVSLSSLKAGQFVVCMVQAKDGKNIAQSIQVQ